MTTGDVDGGPQADRVTIRQNGLNMSDCRWRVSCQPRWVHHRNAAIQGKPDSPLRIRDHGLMTFDTFQASQAIRKAILSYISFSQGVP